MRSRGQPVNNTLLQLFQHRPHDSNGLLGLCLGRSRLDTEHEQSIAATGLIILTKVDSLLQTTILSSRSVFSNATHRPPLTGILSAATSRPSLAPLSPPR